MKRRSFLGAIFGGGLSIGSVSTIARDSKPKNPLAGEKLPFVRVFEPIKRGDKLTCTLGADGEFHAWKTEDTEKQHCVAIMDATFEIKNPHLDDDMNLYWTIEKGRPYSQVIVVSVITP